MLDLNYQPIEIVDTEGMPNDEWLKYRTTGIGGSDVSAIHEVSGWTTKRALYYAKIGLEKSGPENPFTLDFGHAVEPFVATWFQKQWNDEYKAWIEAKIGKKVSSFTIYKDTMMYRHPNYPFMQANLDYRIRLLTEDGEIKEGIFECKTTSFHIGPDKWANEKVPYEYELQCRHYMSIMNLDFTIIACLWGNNVNDYCARFIKRDLDIEEEIIDMERDFWENNVKAKNPPPLSSEHAEQEEEAFKSYKIADRIKRGEITEINASKEVLLDAAKKYLAATEKADTLTKAAEKANDEAKKQKVCILECLANQLDDAEKSQLFAIDEAILIERKRVDTSRIDSARLKKELPDIAKNYSKTSTSYRFDVRKYS